MNNGGITSSIATVDYLQLLTIQLQNQDPIDPVDQEGLINDLTQFAILEGIENLNTSFSDSLKLQELSDGASFVGKDARYRDPSSGEIRTGTVTEMFQGTDSINLLIDGETVALDNVVGVATT